MEGVLCVIMDESYAGEEDAVILFSRDQQVQYLQIIILNSVLHIAGELVLLAPMWLVAEQNQI